PARGKDGEEGNQHDNRESIAGDKDRNQNGYQHQYFSVALNGGLCFAKSFVPRTRGERLLLYWAVAANAVAFGATTLRSTIAMAPKQFAFPKSRRLTLSSEFERVKANGRVERGHLLLLSVLATKESSPFRAGFITSRALGSAVARKRD